MMHWLLKNEGYPPAIAVAVLLHGILLWFIVDRANHPTEMVEIKPPSIVAKTVQQNPQRMRRAEQIETERKKQQQQQARDRELQRERAAEQERQKEEVARKEAAEKERVAKLKRDQEQEQNRKKEDDRKKVAQEQEKQRERERQQKAAKEKEQQEAALAQQQEALQRALTEEEQLVSQYVQIIKDLIAQNWQLPANPAGKRAVVELRTTPTGEIISSKIVESSGDALFDASVLNAVKRAESFPELKELPIAVFERHFRQFSLVFQPEDLLR
jgi:colicin import membrane protein